MHSISMPSFMEIYKLDRTFQAKSPDSIDPGRTQPNVPWAWHISDDVGCANPIVGRVFIQCASALNNKRLRRGNIDKIKIALHTCKEDLRNCEKAFQRLAQENDNIVKVIKDTGGVKVERRVVNNLPQIPNLENDATIFLTSAKRALQSICEILNEFYEITIRNARIDIGRNQLRSMKPPPTDLLAMLDQFTAVTDRVVNLRNFQEHTPKTTIVENFKITANELLSPMWRIEPEPAVKMLPEMCDIIGSLIELAEHVFFHGLMDNLDAPSGPFCYVVEEVPNEHRNGAALRYRCELKFAQSPPSSGSPTNSENGLAS